MVLYTPLSLDDVWSENQTREVVFESVIEGRQVLLRRGPDGMARLERLWSTEPNDYLDPAWSPGTVLTP